MKRTLWNRGGTGALVLAALVTLAAPSEAQVTFTLTPEQATTAPGTSLLFTALLVNNSQETVDLVGDLANTDHPGIAWDDASINEFLNAFGALAPGEQFGGTLLLSIGGGVPVGQYTASYQLELEGLTTGTPFSAGDSVAITVENRGGGVTAPEPGTLALAGVGLAALRLARRRGAVR